MKNFRTLIAGGLLASAALVSVPANAMYIGDIPGGTNSNDFITKYFGGAPVEGWYGANLYLVGGPADITIEFFGYEAGYLNSFWFGGDQQFANQTGACTASTNCFPGSGSLDGNDVVTPSVTIQNVGSGLLNFWFEIVNGAITNSVANGSNGDNLDGSPNFFMSFDAPAYLLDTLVNNVTSSSGQSVFLFLDDGGNTNDDNHDDMVIRLSISNGHLTVPEPGTLALLGLGLLGLGAARRRKA